MSISITTEEMSVRDCLDGINWNPKSHLKCGYHGLEPGLNKKETGTKCEYMSNVTNPSAPAPGPSVSRQAVCRRTVGQNKPRLFPSFQSFFSLSVAFVRFLFDWLFVLSKEQYQ